MRYSLLFTTILMLVIPTSASTAQQWNGSTTTSGDLYREGRTYVADTLVSDGQPGNLHLGLKAFASDGSTDWRWVLNTADPDGGFGIGPRNLEIWEYPTGSDGGGNCCRPRFIIEDSYGLSNGPLNLYLDNDGSVGIGTTTPDNKLEVKGKVRAEEVIVETGWADFVFEDDYDLRSLAEVEAHINVHGHLPGIPSAEEVEDDGVKLGEIQSKLLQKIEELTLYAIAQQKEIEKLKADKKR